MKLILEVPPTSYDCLCPDYLGMDCESEEALYVALEEAMRAFILAETDRQRAAIRVLGHEVDLSAFLCDAFDLTSETIEMARKRVVDGKLDLGWLHLDTHIMTLDEFFESVRIGSGTNS